VGFLREKISMSEADSKNEPLFNCDSVKKDYKTGIDLVKDEKDDFLEVSHIVLNSWQNCVRHLFNTYCRAISNGA